MAHKKNNRCYLRERRRQQRAEEHTSPDIAHVAQVLLQLALTFNLTVETQRANEVLKARAFRVSWRAVGARSGATLPAAGPVPQCDRLKIGGSANLIPELYQVVLTSENPRSIVT